MIRLRTEAKTDAARAGPVTVLIERRIGLVHVRPLRRRRLYTLPLAAVAEMIVARVTRAELLEKRLARALARRNRKS